MTSLTKSSRASRSAKSADLKITDQYDSVPRSSSARTWRQNSAYCCSSLAVKSTMRAWVSSDCF